jgi:hypothetical protein
MIGRKLSGIPLKLTLGEKNLKKGWWRSKRGKQLGFSGEKGEVISKIQEMITE